MSDKSKLSAGPAGAAGFSQDALMTVREVAAFLRVSTSWVYHRAEAGLLPCVRIGSLLRFERGAILAALKA